MISKVLFLDGTVELSDKIKKILKYANTKLLTYWRHFCNNESKKKDSACRK